MVHQEARQEVFQEPFTAVPNIYYDRIKPVLTDSQRAVADVVIRETIGWHEDSARISNATFMERTGKSEPAIIRAKKELIAMGLLLVKEAGGGATTTRYALDLHCKDKPWSPQIMNKPRQHQSPTVMDESDYQNIQEKIRMENVRPIADVISYRYTCADIALETPCADANSISIVESNDLVESEYSSRVSDSITGFPSAMTIREPVADVSEYHPQDGFHEAVTPEASGSIISDSPNVTLAPPPDPGIYNNNNNNKKQTVDDKSKIEGKESRKQAYATVCSLLRSWNIKLESKDYTFIGWIHKTYGIEAVQEKIQIMKFQRSRGVRLINPLGWLRSALARDYQHSRWDSEIVKAKEKSRRAIKRSHRESEELKQGSENYNWDLGQKAIQNIINILEEKDND